MCDCEPAELYTSKLVKTRKPHRCIECRIQIELGQQAEKVDALYDGRFTSFYTCLECKTLIEYLRTKKIVDDCLCHGDLGEEIDQQGFLYSDDDIEEECEHLPFYDESKGVVRGLYCLIATKVDCIVIRQGKLRLNPEYAQNEQKELTHA